MRKNSVHFFVNKWIGIIAFAWIGIVAISCDRNRYYEENVAITNEKWFYQDAKTFELEMLDTLSPFNFYLNVRNTIDYKYANLYFFIQTDLPNGTKAIDTIECQLANYEGKWLGSGHGKFRDNQFILRKNMQFQQSGKYRFSLRQGMREDSLKGIVDVGIRLEKAY